YCRGARKRVHPSSTGSGVLRLRVGGAFQLRTGSWTFSAGRSLPLSQILSTPLSFVPTAHLRDNIATILSRRVLPRPHSFSRRGLIRLARKRMFLHRVPESLCAFMDHFLSSRWYSRCWLQRFTPNESLWLPEEAMI